MGSPHSKEEVIIAQTASGDAQATQKNSRQLSTTDILVFVILILIVLAIIYVCIKKIWDRAINTLRREFNSAVLRNTISSVELATTSAQPST